MSIGIILIIIGALLLFGFNIFTIGYHALLILAGIIFLATYIQKGAYRHYGNVGVLIPAVILILQGVTGYLPAPYQYSTFAVSIAFFLIYFVHTMHFIDVSTASRVWPLIPAFILLLESINKIPVLRMIRKQTFGLVFILAGATIIYYYNKNYDKY